MLRLKIRNNKRKFDFFVYHFKKANKDELL